MQVACIKQGCSGAVKVPDAGAGPVTVRCATCGTSFAWSAPGSRFEIRELALRCARTGLGARAVFVRDRPTDLFRLARVLKGDASVVALAEDWRAERHARAMADAWRGVRGWLRRAGRLWAGDGKGGPETGVPKDEMAKKATPYAFNLSELEIGAVVCPHCETRTPYRFLQCNVCGELVCGGRIEARDGRHVFHCRSACSGTGIIEGPPIESFPGKDFTLAPDEAADLRRAEAEAARLGLAQRVLLDRQREGRH